MFLFAGIYQPSAIPKLNAKMCPVEKFELVQVSGASKSTKSTFHKSSSFVYSKPDDFIQCYIIFQVVNVVFYMIATILPNTIEKFISSLLHY